MSQTNGPLHAVVAITSTTALLELSKVPSIVRSVRSIQEFMRTVPLTVVGSYAHIDEAQVLLDRHNLFASFTVCDPDDPRALAAALEAEIEHFGAIMIHDASRPLTRSEQFAKIMDTFNEGADAVRPATVFTETLKIIGENSVVLETLDRNSVKRIATPEIVRSSAIDRKGKDQGWFLPLKKNARIEHIEGAPEALRINTKEDGLLMESFLHWRRTSG